MSEDLLLLTTNFTVDFEAEECSARKQELQLAPGVDLAPGRELASQIGQVAEAIGQSLNINVQCILGGRTKLKIMNPSFNDVDVLIGSFGAVSKLVTTGIYRMDQVQHVVLDEADTMLDDSFNDKLGYFLSKFPVS